MKETEQTYTLKLSQTQILLKFLHQEGLNDFCFNAATTN